MHVIGISVIVHNAGKKFKVALYSFFGARSMGTNGMSARVFKRKTTKINMAARLLSRFAFHLPLSLLSRTTVHQKTARHVLKNTLLST